MLEFQNLLTYGYFPPELPPCFTTESLGNCADAVRRIVNSGELKSKDYDRSAPLLFSAYKNETSRRKFAVINPLHFAKAALVIEKNSDELFKVFDRSSASLTKPLNRKAKNASYAKPSNSVADTKEALKRFYSRNIFEIRLDVQSFFSSIYTHSIAWAIHSKPVAKKERGKHPCGNAMDECMCNMNSGQTNGILAGNDISRIISEVILCTVDGEIEKRLGSKDFRRFVDDYFFYTDSRADADRIIAITQQVLSEYELELNASKVRVNQSPLIFDNRFVDEIRNYFKLEPTAFVEHLVFSYSQAKDLRLLRYGLRVLQNADDSPLEQWSDIEPYLLNIWRSIPSLSDIIVPILAQNRDCLRKRQVQNVIASIISHNLPLGNDLEVIWALWAAACLNVVVSQERLCSVLDSDNWLAIILALDIIKSRGRTEKKGIKPRIEQLRHALKDEYFSPSATKGMFSEVWLLAYEATRCGWLDTGAKKKEKFDPARQDKFFKMLLDEGVEFYCSPFDVPEQREDAQGGVDAAVQPDESVRLQMPPEMSQGRPRTISEMILKMVEY